MKKMMTLVLAAGLLACAQSAQAIDFKAKGQWLMGFSLGQGSFLRSVAGQRVDHEDKFSAAQRVRLQMDAVASEYLSGTVYFEIGDQHWGKANEGGALGADGKIVEVKNAYLDWTIPETDWKVRMGIQNVALPSAAGGSAVMDDDAAGIIVHGPVTENIGLLAAWVRPLNDNYTSTGAKNTGNDKDGYLDNVDIFALAAPMTFDGVSVTPWVSLVLFGQNALRNIGIGQANFLSNYGSYRWNHGAGDGTWGRSKANTVAFWAGLPVKLSLWDPLNVEFDFNYGYAQSQGRGWIENSDGIRKRFDTRREGWLAKALVEYKMDWGVPGIFGWYASGDDGSIKNGSERMPSVSPAGCFTTFMGDMEYWDWAPNGLLADRNLSYAGTWGIGLQLRDMSFVENLKHTFRVAYWGGTNSPSMVKFMEHPWSWNDGTLYDGPYLTTHDGILEFNLVNSWQIYENFEANLELGYLVNFVDKDTWKRSWMNESFKKQDAWKAQLIFAYRF
jgi:hypothetical protein